MERKNKRIIIAGPSASGKTYIAEEFMKKGYVGEISCTTREIRPGEQNGVDYNFLTITQFEDLIERKDMYEYVKYGKHYYGTLISDFYRGEVFVWETEGLKQLKPEDRDSTLIIYVNTPPDIRLKRMHARGWNTDKITERLDIDDKVFKNFTNFDIEIQS